MKELIFVFDPRRSIMVAYLGTKQICFLKGNIAERHLEKMLCTDVKIELGEFLTPREKAMKNDKTFNN